ncbi:MAG: hypothetical protein JSV88_28790 [Candidatus Aminicenantes bacterium]|nr:MAG: hypothetical protein JSV88_28790 [Candidatus Aminicenantes bacterium]
MLSEKRSLKIRKSGSRISTGSGSDTESTDIPIKKIKKKITQENPLISGVSRTITPGIADIAVKKTNKGLDIYFGLC